MLAECFSAREILYRSHYLSGAVNVGRGSSQSVSLRVLVPVLTDRKTGLEPLRRATSASPSWLMSLFILVTRMPTSETCRMNSPSSHCSSLNA
jgi:hypothetical protein